MKKNRWYIILALALVLSSAAVYLLQVFIFHKIEDTEFYMLQDLAFVPIQVLLVMLIIDRLLKKKEREGLMIKLNMAIGVFFSSMGTDLLRMFVSMDENREALRDLMNISGAWTDKDFGEKMKIMKAFPGRIELETGRMTAVREFLVQNRDNMLRLLENPNLLEHETFTDLLWAVFHFLDELAHRPDLGDLPKGDRDHLRIDATRAYSLLALEWLSYMKHLKENYPYLFSIAVRLNPFHEKQGVIIY